MEAEGKTKDIGVLVDLLEDFRWGSVDRIESKDISIHGGYGFEII